MDTSQSKEKNKIGTKTVGKDNLKANHHTLNSALQPACRGAFTFIFHRNCTWVDGYKVFSVSHGHTGKKERRRTREAPGIPGCHPRSRPRGPRLRPPPLAAASARETGEAALTGAGRDHRPPPQELQAPRPRPGRPHPPTHAGRAAPRRRPQPGTMDAPPDLEVSGNGGTVGNPGALPLKAPDPSLGCGYSPASSRERLAKRRRRTGASPGVRAVTGRAGGPGRGAGEETGLEPAWARCGRAGPLPPPPPGLRPPRRPPPRRAPHPGSAPHPRAPADRALSHHFRREGRGRRRTSTPGRGRRK